MIEPISILHIAGHTFRLNPKRIQWIAPRIPWRIKHDDHAGWFAVNVATNETLTTRDQSQRQLQSVLALRLRREATT